MKIQKRKILLLIDNCPAHPPVTASNVRLVFLPPNTTSRLQPCDAGIIRAFKAHYRKHLLRHVLFHMDECNQASDLAKQVNLLDSILWVNTSWTSVTSETIQKCFSKCGIGAQLDEQQDQPQYELQPDDHLSELLDGTSWDQFTNCDEDVCTFATATSDSQQTATPIGDDEDDDEETDAADPAPPDDEETDAADPAPSVSLKLALQSLQTLQTFALENEDDKILKLVDQIKQLIEQMKWLQITTSKQTKLDDYFK